MTWQSVHVCSADNEFYIHFTTAFPAVKKVTGNYQMMILNHGFYWINLCSWQELSWNDQIALYKLSEDISLLLIARHKVSIFNKTQTIAVDEVLL